MIRRLFFVLTFLFLTECIIYAAEKYEVSVESSLNIRSAPNANSSVLGTLSDGNKIEVDFIRGGWAKFSYKGQDAYVNSSYISKVENTYVRAASGRDHTYLLYLIITLSVILYLIRKFVRKDSPFEGTPFYINYVLVAAMCFLEILYFGVFGGDVWFCSPQLVGWKWSVINFFIFVWIMYNQLMLFFNTLEDVQYKSYTVDYRVGYYSYVIGLILLLVCEFFGKEYICWVLGAMGLAQLGQVILIFKYMLPDWRYAMMNTLMYLLGGISTILIFMKFLPFLVLAAVIGVIVIGLESNSGRRKKYCNTCNSFSNGYCVYWKDRVNSESGCSKHHFRNK